MYNETDKPHSGYSYPFDERCMENLKTLVLETEAKLVITSVWRKTEYGRCVLLNELKKYELDKHVIGYTPILIGIRGKEIEAFLSVLNCEVKFVILDDNSHMGGFCLF